MGVHRGSFRIRFGQVEQPKPSPLAKVRELSAVVDDDKDDGRGAEGEPRNRARFSRKIVSLREQGLSVHSIAKLTGVSYQTVINYLKARHWGDFLADTRPETGPHLSSKKACAH